MLSDLPKGREEKKSEGVLLQQRSKAKGKKGGKGVV